MSARKYFERLERMDQLIRRKATGSPNQFAEKMGINRSTLMRNLAEIKRLGAEIQYDPIRQTYFYEESGRLEIGFKKISNDQMKNRSGGQTFYHFFHNPII